MRTIIFVALILSACSQEQAAPSIATGSFAGEGRDRLCINDRGGALHAGFIIYGDGDKNCSAGGELVQKGQDWVLIPRGETELGCRIPLTIASGVISVGQPNQACDYYCGPAVQMSGKSFGTDKSANIAADFAGDPLC